MNINNTNPENAFDQEDIVFENDTTPQNNSNFQISRRALFAGLTVAAGTALYGSFNNEEEATAAVLEQAQVEPYITPEGLSYAQFMAREVLPAVSEIPVKEVEGAISYNVWVFPQQPATMKQALALTGSEGLESVWITSNQNAKGEVFSYRLENIPAGARIVVPVTWLGQLLPIKGWEGSQNYKKAYWNRAGNPQNETIADEVWSFYNGVAAVLSSSTGPWGLELVNQTNRTIENKYNLAVSAGNSELASLITFYDAMHKLSTVPVIYREALADCNLEPDLFIDANVQQMTVPQIVEYLQVKTGLPFTAIQEVDDIQYKYEDVRPFDISINMAALNLDSFKNVDLLDNPAMNSSVKAWHQGTGDICIPVENSDFTFEKGGTNQVVPTHFEFRSNGQIVVFYKGIDGIGLYLKQALPSAAKG